MSHTIIKYIKQINCSSDFAIKIVLESSALIKTINFLKLNSERLIRNQGLLRAFIYLAFFYYFVHYILNIAIYIHTI